MQSSGLIYLSQIQSQFGGVNPVYISEYMSDNASQYTAGVQGIPSTGQMISLGNFYGKAKPVATSSSFGAPFDDICRTVFQTTSSYDNLPLVTFGGTNWYLQHNFGSVGRWNGLRLRNWLNGTIDVQSNYTLPTSVHEVKTDWTNQYVASYGLGGWKDDATNGTNSIYQNYNSLFVPPMKQQINTTTSSSMMFYAPSWARQICLVAADYYRLPNQQNSYWWSTNGTSWSNVGVASWRGSTSAWNNVNIPENPSSSADMAIFNVTGTGYLMVLDTVNTVCTVGFVLLKP